MATASCDDRERREAEEVHLEHAGFLERVHVVLRDDDRASSPLAVAPPAPVADVLGGGREDRDVVVERARRDDDARRVDAGVARESFERDRVVEELLVALVALVELRRPRRTAAIASFTVSE